MTQQVPYVLEQRPEEIARLIAYAEREAEDVRMVCRRIALGRGGSAVDVGHGPLAVETIIRRPSIPAQTLLEHARSDGKTDRHSLPIRQNGGAR